MADLAVLGLAVDSTDVSDASRELDRIAQAAAKAEGAADSFGNAKTEAAGRSISAERHATMRPSVQPAFARQLGDQLRPTRDAQVLLQRYGFRGAPRERRFRIQSYLNSLNCRASLATLECLKLETTEASGRRASRHTG